MSTESPEKQQYYMPMDQTTKRPELLMAAREGDPERLSAALLSCNDNETAITIDKDDDSVRPAEAVTSGLDSILHMVASAGDSAGFLASASMIHSKARHLLVATNSRGDTPLHCAARDGRVEMVSHLIQLARDDEAGGDERVKAMLRKQNRQRETALHEALRLPDEQMAGAMVGRLMSADPHLARIVPEVLGASPLYLAVSLGLDNIATQLHDKDEGLSYCGPHGKNVMHAAVLHRNTGMADVLINWGEHGLIKQGDQPDGNTPLHLAASCAEHKMVKLLLDAEQSSAYQFDNKGSLPIHMAAMKNVGKVVCVFLDKCPSCADVRDAEGRTFLHVAVLNRNSDVVSTVFRFFQGRQKLERFETIVNMRDRDGNTGLHLAVQNECEEIFYCLLNKRVLLNLQNSMGRTALDLAKKPTSLRSVLDPRITTITMLLWAAGAEYGAHHQDRLDPNVKKEEKSPQKKEKKEEKEATNISEEAAATAISEPTIQTIGLIAGLLFTVCFATAFAIPGGYRAGDDPVAAGTPVLATRQAFQGFVVANNLALLCAALAIICLGYALAMLTTRFVDICIYLLHCSFRSLAAAFAFGMDAALSPVARATAFLTWIGMTLIYTDVVWLTYKLAWPLLKLRKRLGSRAWLRAAAMILWPVVATLWPYVIILSVLAYYKTHGVHGQ